MLHYPVQQEDLINQVGELHRLAFCADFSPLHARSCAEALQYILKEVRPVQNDNLFYVQAEVKSDPFSLRAAWSLALIIQGRIDALSPPSGNLWDDTLQAFENAGVIHLADRIEKALKLLATYSTNGPVTWRYGSMGGDAIATPLRVIGTGITVLNSQSKGQYLYTLPAQVHSRCDNAKPYHFWMSAYLAYAAAKKFKSPEAGRTAAFIAALGYQMRAEREGTRDPEQIFREPPHAPYANAIRMDLAHVIHATRWSVSLLRNKPLTRPLSIDQTLKKMMDRSGKLGAAAVYTEKNLRASGTKDSGTGTAKALPPISRGNASSALVMICSTTRSRNVSTTRPDKLESCVLFALYDRRDL